MPNENINDTRFPVRRLNRILTMLFYEMKDLQDEGRDFPIRWHVMHMYSSSQLAKIMAIQRGIDPELASIAAALHDIGEVMTKKHEGHEVAAEKYVTEFLRKYNDESRSKLQSITQEEIDRIVKAIVKHREKGEDSNDPFIELLKDVDSLDRYLHGVKTEGAHLERCNRVMRELKLK